MHVGSIATSFLNSLYPVFMLHFLCIAFLPGSTFHHEDLRHMQHQEIHSDLLSENVFLITEAKVLALNFSCHLVIMTSEVTIEYSERSIRIQRRF